MSGAVGELGVTERGLAEEVARRPGVLLALGEAELPHSVTIGGEPYTLREPFKHDAFAATGLYAAAEDGTLAVVKFGRRSSCFGIPLRWLGRYLAAKERRYYGLMAAEPRVPPLLGPVAVGDAVWREAFAHAFVAGQPLTARSEPSDAFFPELQRLIEAVHARGIAFVDLNKRENIIVDADGLPHLIDFQLACARPDNIAGVLPGWPLYVRIQQRSDRYHLMKHWIRLRPDQLEPSARDLNRHRPGWVRAWRLVGRPFIRTRRRLLVLLGVRAAA